MHTVPLTAGWLAIGAAAVLLGSPVAQADDAGFVRDVEAIGFVHGPENLISTADSACYFLSRNRTPFEVEERVQRYLRVDAGQARQFLILAVGRYCTQYVGVVGV